ncbi:MAG: hypothetical protein K0R82_1447 [Flavipsychrobacter sp.]|jgi:hypothetical protein|nr:hypothetical protein [Flavipsychrobacter sp.]
MKNFICSILALLGFVLYTETTYAAFPAHSEPAVSVKTEKRSFREFINSAIERHQLPAPAVGDETDEGGKFLNLFAFGLGMTGLIALIAAFLVPTFIWVLGTVAVVTGVAAIIAGDKGMERSPLRGLGTTGFVLGIINLSLVFIALVAALFFLAFLLFVN